MHKHRWIQFDSTSNVCPCDGVENRLQKEEFLSEFWQGRVRERSFFPLASKEGKTENYSHMLCNISESSREHTRWQSQRLSSSNIAAVLVCVSISMMFTGFLKI